MSCAALDRTCQYVLLVLFARIPSCPSFPFPGMPPSPCPFPHPPPELCVISPLPFPPSKAMHPKKLTPAHRVLVLMCTAGTSHYCSYVVRGVLWWRLISRVGNAAARCDMCLQRYALSWPLCVARRNLAPAPDLGRFRSAVRRLSHPICRPLDMTRPPKRFCASSNSGTNPEALNIARVSGA